MNGPLAQLVALTCQGNAFMEGKEISRFFPDNSTCQFCDHIHFIEFEKGIFGKPKEKVVADSPDDWFTYQKKKRITGFRMGRKPTDDPQISDRMSAGFVGGGGEWTLQAISEGFCDYWIARWEVWNQNAPERKIWRVDYGLVRSSQNTIYELRDLEVVWKEFKESLVDIHDFSGSYTQDGFTDCFAKALVAIDDPDADIGYHKDLYISDLLSPLARSILKAAMSSWVYGGMGSWNDMGFDGEAQKEYDRVSERHFSLLNEAIEVAASSSHRNNQAEQAVPPNGP